AASPRDYAALHALPTRRSSDLAAYQINDAEAALVVNLGPDAPTGGRPAIHVDRMRTVRRNEPRPPVELDGEDLALLIYTSGSTRSEEHTSELQSRENLVCRLLL